MCFYKVGPIDHCTHVPGPVDQYSAEIEYNAVCTAGMALENLIILNNDLLNKDPCLVTEQSPIIILDGKSAICMANNGKDTKQTRHIYRRMRFVRNGEDYNLHETVLCGEVLQLSSIGINNGRGD